MVDRKVKDNESVDASDYIKPFVEETQDVSIDQEKPKKTTPFDFIKSVSETKKDIIKEDPELEKDYNAFIVNRGFGYFPDTVLHANELNMLPDIPRIAQYYYYMASLRKRKRFSKWYKLEPNEDLKLVQDVYNVRVEVAKEYLKVLTEENIQTLRKLTETGESSPKAKTKKNK